MHLFFRLAKKKKNASVFQAGHKFLYTFAQTIGQTVAVMCLTACAPASRGGLERRATIRARTVPMAHLIHHVVRGRHDPRKAAYRRRPARVPPRAGLPGSVHIPVSRQTPIHRGTRIWMESADFGPRMAILMYLDERRPRAMHRDAELCTLRSSGGLQTKRPLGTFLRCRGTRFHAIPGGAASTWPRRTAPW